MLGSMSQISPNREKRRPRQMAPTYGSVRKMPGNKAALNIKVVVSGLKI